MILHLLNAFERKIFAQLFAECGPYAGSSSDQSVNHCHVVVIIKNAKYFNLVSLMRSARIDTNLRIFHLFSVFRSVKMTATC